MGNSYLYYSLLPDIEANTSVSGSKLIDTTSGGKIAWSLTTGKPLDFAVKNPGGWKPALTNQSWDAVVMQPHVLNGWLPFQDEVRAARTIIQTAKKKNPNTVFYILGPYAFREGPDQGNYPNRRRYSDNWARAYERNDLIATLIDYQGGNEDGGTLFKTLFNVRHNFQSLYWDQVREENPGVDVRWIPLGEVMYEIDLALKNLPSSHPLKASFGLQGCWDFVGDGTHLGTFGIQSNGLDGRYISHQTILSTLWNQHPSNFKTVYETGKPASPYTISTINADLKQLVDPIIWKVVSRHKARYYVDGDATAGSQDGSSWANAFVNLQDALDAASPNGGEIWVADGIYYPDQGENQTTGERDSTFKLSNGIRLYGGFTGTEVLFSERNPDPETNGTVLSGDLNRDGDITGSSDNSYHILTATNTNTRVVLDAFTVRFGNATDQGGGLYASSSSLTIRNCRFTQNNAALGGGAVALNDASNPRFFDTDFAQNSSDEEGGALYTDNNSIPFLYKSVFTENTAVDGGAIYCESNTGVSLLLCMLDRNTASSNGGALFADSTNTRPFEVINSLFSLNTAEAAGGAIYSKSKLVLTNATISFNKAGEGGAIASNGGSVELSNSILWSDSASTFSEISGSVSGKNNLVKWQEEWGVEGTDPAPAYVSITMNPGFVEDPKPEIGTLGNLKLLPTSPGIDKGDETVDLDAFGESNFYGPYLTMTGDLVEDLAGSRRILGKIDLGAYEFAGPEYQFDYWIQDNFPIARDEEIETLKQSRLAEFAFGINPLNSGGEIIQENLKLLNPGYPIAVLDRRAETPILKAIFARRKDFQPMGLSYRVKFSNDMVLWNYSSFEPEILDSQDEFELVGVPFPSNGGIKSALFFQVEVELTE